MRSRASPARDGARAAGFSYSDVNEDVSAYRIANHNHQPEMAQELSRLREGPEVAVTFVPHLVLMTRGIHATCYASLAENVSQSEVLAIYRAFYADAPFTSVTDAPPHTKHTYGSNDCLVHPTIDEPQRRARCRGRARQSHERRRR